MRVYVRCHGDGGMAHPDLGGLQIDAGGVADAGKGVAQHVGSHLEIQRPDHLVPHAPEGGLGHHASGGAGDHPQGSAGRAGQDRRKLSHDGDVPIGALGFEGQVGVCIVAHKGDGAADVQRVAVDVSFLSS